MWDPPNDPQIFGALDIDAAPMQAAIARLRELGSHVTPTHLVGRAVAHALVAVPDVNVQLRRGWVTPRDAVEVFFITSVAGGRDLSGVKITHVDRKSVTEVARELTERSAALKQGKDPEFARTKALTDRLPRFALRAALRFSAFVTQQLRLDVPALGLHPSPFGSAMVTSVGMLGLPQGFAPLAWMYDVPLLVLVGEIVQRPVVVDRTVVARAVLPITATIDHRYADGWHVKQLMDAFREYLGAPERFETALRTSRAIAQSW